MAFNKMFVMLPVMLAARKLDGEDPQVSTVGKGGPRTRGQPTTQHSKHSSRHVWATLFMRVSRRPLSRWHTCHSSPAGAKSAI